MTERMSRRYTGCMLRPTSEDLGALPLFGGVPADALQRFAERAEVVDVPAGAIIFTEGEPARSLYVLQSGGLEVVKRCTGPSKAGPSKAGPSNAGPSNPGPSNAGPSNASPTANGECKLAPIRPGECFGEMSFIDMQPRSATVRATEPSTLWVWTYTSIHERYRSDQKCGMLLVMNIARELSRRLRKTDELLARM
jgi:CRP-like cAMP-binding protein